MDSLERVRRGTLKSSRQTGGQNHDEQLQEGLFPRLLSFLLLNKILMNREESIGGIYPTLVPVTRAEKRPLLNAQRRRLVATKVMKCV